MVLISMLAGDNSVVVLKAAQGGAAARVNAAGFGARRDVSCEVEALYKK